MLVKPYPFLRGVLSYILPKKYLSRPGSGGTFSSEYCYSVWLRHLSYLKKNGLIQSMDSLQNVAEIGPGDSLGIGLSALYSGARNYYAFDVIEHTNNEANLSVNRELKMYFKNAMEVPHGKKYTNVQPKLDNYSFPVEVIDKSSNYFERKSVEIEKALEGTKSEVTIKYQVPWLEGACEDVTNIDLIFSQAVMEHVYDIDFAYNAMFKWLKKGGIVSHEVDFKTHEMTNEWNGHWFIGENLWKFLSHGRKYPMNRLPFSSHIKSLERAGFEIIDIVLNKTENVFSSIKPKIKDVEFSAEDLTISSAYILAIKR